MNEHEDYERNGSAYRRMKQAIKDTYPLGWFVGISDEEITGAAASFRDLECQLRARGTAPRSVLVVEAGVDYPEYVTIFI